MDTANNIRQPPDGGDSWLYILSVNGPNKKASEGKPPSDAHRPRAKIGYRGKLTLVDVVLTNPPFGKKSSITVVNDGGETDRESITYNRPDFWTTTSNKQLNFVQHVKSMLKIPGRAAVVVPDNVLFEGGAGEKVRRTLLQECEVHTLLRLPTGIFYAQGVKANVIFFDRKPGAKEPWTKKVWIYDCRTNKQFTLKERRMVRADLDEFVQCYHPENRHQRTATWHEKMNPEGRWRGFTYDEIVARDKCSLDIFWLKGESLGGFVEAARAACAGRQDCGGFAQCSRADRERARRSGAARHHRAAATRITP